MVDIKQFSGDKILKHIDRVKEFIETGHSRPITAEIDMTNICNHNCPYCFGYYNRKENRNHLSYEEAKDIINQIKKAGILAVTFTGGGDPLVNKNTIVVMEYAKGLGIDVALITNGLALDEETSKRALNICTWIRISVDADSSELYFKTHGVTRQSWDMMIKNVKKIVALKKELRSECTIGVGYLTMPQTAKYENMVRFVKLFKEIGVDYSQFRPIMPRWDEDKNIIPDNSEEDIKRCLIESTDKYDVLYSKPKYDMMKRSKEEWRPYPVCLGVNFTITISADKKVYVCCHHRGIEKYCLGNLGEESFENIWERRKETFDKIDFRDCPYFCRNNPFNVILYSIKSGKQEIKEIKEERKHANFL